MRRILGLVTTAAIVAGSIALAAPANAADATATCAAAGSFNFTVATGGTFEVVVGDADCDKASWDWNMPTIQSGVTVTLPPSTTPVPKIIQQPVSLNSRILITNAPGSPTSVSLIIEDSGANLQMYFITFSGSGGGGGGGGSSSSDTSSAPVLETLTLQVSTSNTTCTGGSPTGYSGSWLQLPAADACSQSGPNANPNAKLLGWATSAQFPVSVAQQIVDLKYGPIDAVIDGTRMIFIPAGGWTFVSGSNNLFPIWSS